LIVEGGSRSRVQQRAVSLCLQKNDVAAANQFISAAKAELAAQHQKAAELKSGMDIFNILQPTYKELTQNEKVSWPCTWLGLNRLI